MHNPSRRKMNRLFMLTLTRSLFLGFAVAVLAMLAVTWRAAHTAHTAQVTAATQAKVRGALMHTDAELRAWFAPMDNALHLLRDWIVSGLAASKDRIALNQQLHPILRANPRFLSIRVARNDGFEHWLFQEEDSWRSRTVQPGPETNGTVWAKWTLDGCTLLQENNEPGGYDPRKERWYEEAVARCRNRADRNRDGQPEVYWSVPRMSERGGIMEIAMAVPGANGAQVVVLVECRLNELEDISARLFAALDTAVFLVHPEGLALGLPGRKRVGPQDAALIPEVSQVDHPLARAYEAWKRDRPREAALFPLEEPAVLWWCGVRAFPLSADAALMCVAGAPQAPIHLAAPFDENVLGGIFAGGLALSAMLAVLLGRGFARPVRAFVRRVRGLDAASPFIASPGSYIAEFNDLAKACEEIACLVEERVHELSLAGAAIPPPGPEVAEAAQDMMPGAGLEHVGVNPDGQEPASTPPQAFLLALRTTRRRLRAAEDKLDVLNAAVHAQTDRLRAYEERLSAQRDALSALAHHENGVYEPFPAACVHMIDIVRQVLGVDRVSLWEKDPAASRYVCAHCMYSETLPNCTGAAVETAACALLWRAVSVEDVVRLSDAANDPRVRAWPFTPPQPGAMLLLPVRCGGDIVMLLCIEHGHGPRHWHADEEGFAQHVAYMLGAWNRRQPRS